MDGHSLGAAEGASGFRATNPATGEQGPLYRGHTPGEARQIATLASLAFGDWRKTSFELRAGLMGRAAALLRERADRYALLMAREMGKPISAGRVEIEKCADHIEHFAAQAHRYLAAEPVDLPGEKAFVTFNPLGVILAVMPWNFPFWQVVRFAAPALMAGNTALLKHASNVPGSALAIEELFRDAGFPEHVFRTLLIPSGGVKALIEDPAVAAVTLTGSVAAGRSVATQAGAVLKKCVLELGGSDPYLVLADADVADAARICAAARMVNGGQSCIAGKRFIVDRRILAAFETALVEEMGRFEMRDPLDEESGFGPMVSVPARDQIHDQVLASVRGGARLLLGGEIPARPGAWYPPTVLTDVRPGLPAHDEEIFGPVAAIIAAQDEADAIRIANDSEFGLGSGVLTADLARGERIAAEALEAGTSFVNGNVRSYSRMPFGGVKNSGYGRECSAYGIREFVNIKSVRIRLA
jgi:succinate-semialdehyde dehydrogenase/glutarate-semialdehyde dehydrogenase